MWLKFVAGLLGLIVLGGGAYWASSRSEPVKSVSHEPKQLEPSVESIKPIADPPAPPLSQPQFVDIAQLSGIDFSFYTDFDPSRFYLPTIMGGGLVWADFDLNGWVDLYAANGCKVPLPAGAKTHVAGLFLNQEGVQFDNAVGPAQLEYPMYGQGAASGDYDNDGFDDLYCAAVGRNYLFRNNGDGTFTESAVQAGVKYKGWSSSCAFGDLNKDGITDLYVCNYMTASATETPYCEFENHEGKMVQGFCGPAHYEAEPDALFQGNGDGTFTEISEQAGCLSGSGKGLAIVIADLDNDTWPDIYVANDKVNNFYFRNKTDDKGMSFEEIGMSSGTALLENGDPGASMGIACADYDRDGSLDMYVTHYIREGYSLYHATKGHYMDFSGRAGLKAASMEYLGFGTNFLDFDNDSWPDLFVTNGHVLGPFIEPNAMNGQFFANNGKGRFEEVTAWSGPYFHEKHLGRSTANADFNSDGKIDFAVGHLDEPLALLRNDSDADNYLGLELVGERSNRSALGARITVSFNNQKSFHQILGGGSYLSDNHRRLTIGLGDASVVDELQVQWPSGHLDTFRTLEANRYWTLVEGRELR